MPHLSPLSLLSADPNRRRWMALVAQDESGNQNIPQRIHDVNTDRGTPAEGNLHAKTGTTVKAVPEGTGNASIACN